jgi:hypothetical protein
MEISAMGIGRYFFGGFDEELAATESSCRKSGGSDERLLIR